MVYIFTTVITIQFNSDKVLSDPWFLETLEDEHFGVQMCDIVLYNRLFLGCNSHLTTLTSIKPHNVEAI